MVIVLSRSPGTKSTLSVSCTTCRPLIVALKSDGPSLHYVVVVGLDGPAATVYSRSTIPRSANCSRKINRSSRAQWQAAGNLGRYSPCSRRRTCIDRRAAMEMCRIFSLHFLHPFRPNSSISKSGPAATPRSSPDAHRWTDIVQLLEPVSPWAFGRNGLLPRHSARTIGTLSRSTKCSRSWPQPRPQRSTISG